MPSADSDAIRAAAAFDAGNLPLAEAYARAALDLDAHHAPAWTTLGRVAHALTRDDLAHACFAAALKAQPYFEPARAAHAILVAREEAAAAAASNGNAAAVGVNAGASNSPVAPRLLLIRAWGHGFFADVDHVLGQLLVAEATHRTPLVHWGEESLFRAPTDGPRDSAWGHFFAPINPGAAAQVSSALDISPPSWLDRDPFGPIPDRWHGPHARRSGLYTFAASAPLVISDFHTAVSTLRAWLPPSHPLHGATLLQAYRQTIARWLRPRAEIQASAEAFAARHFAGAPVIAAHIRALDKHGEFPDLVATIRGVLQRIEAALGADATLKVFLMSDWAEVIAHLGAKFPGRIISTPSVRGSSAPTSRAITQGIHMARAAPGDQLGREVLTDALIACRCGAFLGMGPSTVSCMIEYFVPWPEGTCILVGKHQTSQHNFALWGARG
ncbi:hypothetical protein BH11PLA1_BH11PLA1_20350 [soil metagenome]